MGFSNEIYLQAVSRVAERRKAAETSAAQRTAEFYAKRPDYLEMKQKLAETGLALVRAVLDDRDDIDSRVEEIKNRNLELQAKMTSLLLEAGYPRDYLKPRYSCTECGDTGYIDGAACQCLKNEMRRIAYEQLNGETPLSLCTFESFRLDVFSDAAAQNGYSPREVMSKTLEKCKKYAEGFSYSSPSLLFQGKVGLGKTHLSLAIAGEVINKGYGVVYGSAQSLFYKIEREYFGKADSSQNDTLSLLKSADLLILDDLGTEFTNQFTLSMLYDLINSRLLASKPTIISTNLDIQQLTEKYTDRIASRIFGSFSRFQFSGSDVRTELRRSRQQKPKEESK